MLETRTNRIFILSPANTSGVRGRLILREQACFELALRLRETGAPLGEIFSFISGLYFRGKLTYARAFAEPPADAPGILVITASQGLRPPESPLFLDELREMSHVPIDAREVRYRGPLERDASQLSGQLGENCEVVLLGSIATSKYAEPLLTVFGNRLVFPVDFIGRGDMSRGGLMLRSARTGSQLAYAPVAESSRRGPRPPRLPKPLRISQPDL
jgi:hypothetical protein